MPEPDEQRLDLQSRLAELEAARLRDEVERLRQRVKLLEDPAPAAAAPRRSESGLSATVALLVAVIPVSTAISTAIYGYMSERREQIVSEHEIVKGHLEKALEAAPEDDFNLKHLRHLRFLKSLAPTPNHFESLANASLIDKLGNWAKNDYDHQLQRINERSINIVENINTLSSEVQAKRDLLGVDKGWYMAEYERWAIHDIRKPPDAATKPKIAQVEVRIQEIFALRQTELAHLTTELDKIGLDWDKIKVALDAESLVYSEPVEPTLFHLRKCHDGSASDCFEFAELSYSQWLRDNDPEGLNAANGAFAVACDRGHGLACTRLARSHRLGQVWPLGLAFRASFGTTAFYDDPTQAGWARSVALLEGAIQLRDPESFNALGWHHWMAESIPKNAEYAGNLFEVSCDLGSNNGCESLATWYREEKKDDAEAQKLYERACSGNEIRACANLINLFRGMRPSQFSEPVWADPTLDPSFL